MSRRGLSLTIQDQDQKTIPRKRELVILMAVPGWERPEQDIGERRMKPTSGLHQEWEITLSYRYEVSSSEVPSVSFSQS